MTEKKTAQNQEPATVSHKFDTALERVKHQLSHLLKNTPPMVRVYTRHLALSQGKMLRSRGLLACAMDRENRISENAVRVSVGIELLHLATLVHDDVIDNASVRRGIPTVQKKFGKRSAVICGDYLLCMAMKCFSQVTERETYIGLSFPDYISRLCGGELLQQENGWNADISPGTCLRIARGKTAALFEGAFRAGAILSDQTESQSAKYARLGRYTGMIFQLTDDCLDYVSDESKIKKPVRSDYEQGVFTLPLVYALKHYPQVKQQINKKPPAKEEIQELVKQCQGVEYTRGICELYYRKARNLLAELDITEEKRRYILQLVNQSYYGILGKEG
ncbi:polyprenyl synthetase family protein [Anaerovorax odorimutans]|uniref:Polyprenyl synthetase family protein n=1 Tax=Anaerovorax odorimutans TaxID=109327 RepID=A0ABT1RMD7_9FIRM|nr:polyprenyl synthetase family protein [Anaerovorax odorimutans]MCQ4636343.1 polyprenyl synthetase family protein [Anaerovorax odorimutans]